MEKQYVDQILKMVPWLTAGENMWVRYDREADVLYIDLLDSDLVDNAELRENNVIVRYRRQEVAGITVLYASTFKSDEFN